MLGQAEDLMREGRAEDALPIALRALSTLREPSSRKTTPTTAVLPALNLVAEIHLELGDPSTARFYFLDAVSLDPTGQKGAAAAADPFLQLAQLSDLGGEDSVSWFARGAAILRREISELDSSYSSSSSSSPSAPSEEGIQTPNQEKDEKMHTLRTKLAGALCGMVEIYMTDLSLDPTAESQCESLISEALLIAPFSAEVLQTLASIRISQSRIAEAQEALRGSMAIWGGGVGPEDTSDNEGNKEAEGAVPDFPTRISLARLLMEVEMEEDAVAVVERLVMEDDGSVEAWYLGGWGLYLLGKKQQQQQEGHKQNGVVNGNHNHDMSIDSNRHHDGNLEEEEMEGDETENLYTQSMTSSREWLQQSLKLYQMVEYEDERLWDHAVELVEEINEFIGEKGEDDEEVEEEWKGFGSDEHMDES